MNAVLVQRRLLGALLGLAIAALGLLLALEAGGRLLDRGSFVLVDYSSVVDDLSGRPWSDGLVRVTAAATVLVGLLVLVAALRRPPRPLLMQAPDGLRCEIPPGEVARVLEITAGRVSGVRSSKARVRSRTARVTASTRLRDTSDLEQQVADACSGRLDALMLERQPRTRVSIRRSPK